MRPRAKSCWRAGAGSAPTLPMQIGDGARHCASPAFGDERVSESAGSDDRIRLLTHAEGDECYATHSAVSPRAADGCIARVMRKPNGARLTSDAALLLRRSSGCWFATHSAVLPRAADGCIARMMRKPNGARMPRCCLLVPSSGCQGLLRDGGCVREGSPAGMDAGGTPAGGGAWARCGAGVCPRTPRLTSALDPGWLWVGDMMCDGVFRQMVMRPLSLSGPSPRVRRVGSSLAGSWPRFIG